MRERVTENYNIIEKYNSYKKKKYFDNLYKRKNPWSINIKSENSFNYFYKKIINKYLKKNDLVLELGSGEGQRTNFLIDKGIKNISCCEISRIAINRAKRSLSKKIIFICQNFMNISFNSYNVLIAIESIYYLNNKDRLLFFKKIYDFLSLNRKNIFIFSAVIIGKTKYKYYFNLIEIKQLLKKFNFKILEESNLSLYNRNNYNPFENYLFKIFNFLVNKFKIKIFYYILYIVPNKIIFQKIFVIKKM